MNEPIGDAARSILDGHIVLSRRLASAGHFPCVEVLDSVSRVAPAITTPRGGGDEITDPPGAPPPPTRAAHMVLPRRRASAGPFPCGEVPASASRVAPAITTPAQRTAATELRKLLAAYREAKDLIEIGAYVPGTNPLVDRAVQLREHIDAFLQQGKQDLSVAAESWQHLLALTGSNGATES